MTGELGMVTVQMLASGGMLDGFNSTARVLQSVSKDACAAEHSQLVSGVWQPQAWRAATCAATLQLSISQVQSCAFFVNCQKALAGRALPQG